MQSLRLSPAVLLCVRSTLEPLVGNLRNVSIFKGSYSGIYEDCGLAGCYTVYSVRRDTAFIFMGTRMNPEDGSKALFRNIGIFLPHNTVSLPRRLFASGRLDYCRNEFRCEKAYSDKILVSAVGSDTRNCAR
jgi:hypothetical protein